MCGVVSNLGVDDLWLVFQFGMVKPELIQILLILL
jgi:hypothetical protein